MIHVKAAKVTSAEDVVFTAEGAGLRDGQPTQAVVLGDGRSVAVDGRHIEVKKALKDGVLVEVKTRQPSAEEK